jgi:catechol 2,3-dioxygenase-like lactoylglutathione lyase family enzyme
MRLQHVALSVSDIAKSGPWYEDLFGFAKVAEFQEPAPMQIFMTPEGQALDLRQDHDVIHEPFTEKRVGLDHVAFVCTNYSELAEWAARLGERGIASSGIVQSQFGSHINFRDPDGIPLEFFLPASAS